MEAFRLIHKAFFRARGSYPAKLGGKAVRVDPDHMGFWQAATANRWEPRAGSAEVMALSWKTWLSLGIADKPDFMKVDIEGSEFTLLPTRTDYLREQRPTLDLSTHTPFLPHHQRREAMARIVEVMALYQTCLNDELEPVVPQSFLDEEALTRFHSFVLED
jgi:hypothetical protein